MPDTGFERPIGRDEWQKVMRSVSTAAKAGVLNAPELTEAHIEKLSEADIRRLFSVRWYGNNRPGWLPEEPITAERLRTQPGKQRFADGIVTSVTGASKVRCSTVCDFFGLAAEGTL